MEKYQIVEKYNSKIGATSKARADVSEIANRLGFIELSIRVRNSKKIVSKIVGRLFFNVRFLTKLLIMKKKSMVLIQTPFVYTPVFSSLCYILISKIKKNTTINLIHDVDELRLEQYERRNDCFNKLLSISDQVISHNYKMTDYLKRYVDNSKIINLEIFDYLKSESVNNTVLFEKKINVAGNLDKSKCGYIYGLGELSRLNVDLFGPSYDSKFKANNVIYKGIFDAEELYKHITGGFGLIWDGDSIHECNGPFGKYLQYNNPHKASFYISCGIPLIIWKKAALAKFVENNKIGIAINDLNEVEGIITNMTRDKYNEYIKSIAIIQNKVCNGYYTKSALNTAIDNINMRDK